ILRLARQRAGDLKAGERLPVQIGDLVAVVNRKVDEAGVLSIGIVERGGAGETPIADVHRSLDLAGTPVGWSLRDPTRLAPDQPVEPPDRVDQSSAYLPHHPV